MPELPAVVPGEPIQANTFGNPVIARVLSRYVDATQRDFQTPIPAAGDTAYLTATAQLQVYDGSAWRDYTDKAYVDGGLALKVAKAGDVMSGNLGWEIGGGNTLGAYWTNGGTVEGAVWSVTTGRLYLVGRQNVDIHIGDPGASNETLKLAVSATAVTLGDTDAGDTRTVFPFSSGDGLNLYGGNTPGTGIRLPGNNVIDLVTAGTARLSLLANGVMELKGVQLRVANLTGTAETGNVRSLLIDISTNRVYYKN